MASASVTFTVVFDGSAYAFYYFDEDLAAITIAEHIAARPIVIDDSSEDEIIELSSDDGRPEGVVENEGGQEGGGVDLDAEMDSLLEALDADDQPGQGEGGGWSDVSQSSDGLGEIAEFEGAYADEERGAEGEQGENEGEWGGEGDGAGEPSGVSGFRWVGWPEERRRKEGDGSSQ